MGRGAAPLPGRCLAPAAHADVGAAHAAAVGDGGRRAGRRDPAADAAHGRSRDGHGQPAAEPQQARAGQAGGAPAGGAAACGGCRRGDGARAAHRGQAAGLRARGRRAVGRHRRSSDARRAAAQPARECDPSHARWRPARHPGACLCRDGGTRGLGRRPGRRRCAAAAAVPGVLGHQGRGRPGPVDLPPDRRGHGRVDGDPQPRRYRPGHRRRRRGPLEPGP